MDGGWADGRMVGWMDWIDGWIDRWVGGLDGWMDRWVGGSMSNTFSRRAKDISLGGQATLGMNLCKRSEAAMTHESKNCLRSRLSGFRAAGDAKMLVELSEARGMQATILELLGAGEPNVVETVSSSAIREALAVGAHTYDKLYNILTFSAANSSWQLMSVLV
eukprot:scaffold244925_cov41-Prasinocladus_malaysianus.AAC.1